MPSISLRRLLSLAGLVILCSHAARPAFACLAEFRSVDWLVARSPLVFDGVVEEVQPLPVARSARRPSSEDEQPSLAKVRIQRLLKGSWDEEFVLVRSGPVRSCVPRNFHFTFRVGDRRLFIAPYYPQDGEFQVVWGRSVLPPTDVAVVEAKIAAAQHYARKYLAELRRDRPEDYREAATLAQLMHRESHNWAPVRYVSHSVNCGYVYAGDSAAEGKLIAALVAELSQHSLLAIRGAAAFDWQREGPLPWPQHPIWEAAIEQVSGQRQGELAELERKYAARILKQAGMTAAEIERALVAFADENRFTIGFPPRLAYGRDLDVTTSFVLAFHHADQGMMVPAFAGNFSTESLQQLNAARVKRMVLDLCSSDQERLRWLGWRAIAEVLGDAFADVVYDDMVSGKHYGTWRALVVENQATTQVRLAALLAEAERRHSDGPEPMFWSSLLDGTCFEKVFVDRAIELLAPEPAQGGNQPPDYVQQVLRNYLDAALAHHRLQTRTTRSADDYRRELAKQDPPNESDGSEAVAGPPADSTGSQRSDNDSGENADEPATERKSGDIDEETADSEDDPFR